MKLKITNDGAGFCVWAGLTDTDPSRDQFGFVIGIGRTQQGAMASAVAALEKAENQLQSEPQTIEGWQRDMYVEYCHTQSQRKGKV